MKKSRIIAAVLSGLLVLGGAVIPSTPARADGTKVVTLGADLSAEQKQTMLNYFKVNTNEVQILTVTNQDERDHLSNYIPLAEIGSRTFSCAYVNPTNSGGIKVRTANLSYVTGNMIASSLTTAGVRNCEVIAAAPFKVSGTGALTGIQMAYETASGEVIAPEKKELAVQEIKVTEDLASVVGNNDATNLVNKAKIEVIQNNVTDTTEIYNIVNNIAVENNVSIAQEQINQVVNLMEGIAEQDYAYDDVKDTLEHVDENLNDYYESEGTQEADVSQSLAEDSILQEIDESDLGLGDDVAVSSTEDQGLEALTYDEEVEKGSEGMEAEVYEGEDTGVEEIPFDESEGWDTEETGAEETGSDEGGLSEQSQDQYDQLVRFCEGEYEGDWEALADAMGDDFSPAVRIDDPELASKLSAAVEDAYYEILLDGVEPSAEDAEYMSDELNAMNDFLKKLFSIDGETPDDEDILSDLYEDEKQGLYDDTILFFEKLYGEEDFEEEANYEETEEEPPYAEESYTDPGYAEEPDYTEETYDYDTGDEGYDEDYYYEDTTEDTTW